MAGDREELTIGELVKRVGGSIKTGPFGTALKAAEYSNDGVPLISVGEIGYGSIRIHPKTPRVSRRVTDRLPEYLLETGDIVFGRKGAVDRSARIGTREHGWFLGSDGIRLRLPEAVDSRFMGYQLQSSRVREWILQHATGTTMPSLNQGVIERIPVTLPPLVEQRAIASILGVLDDKIELNRKTNETLEAMARTLFKSWFVDFDPVRAKAEGRAPSGMDAETATLFPSELVESELGPIPKGWRVVSVGDLLSLEYGKALKASDRRPGHVLVFGSNGLVGRHSEALVRGSGIVVGRKGNPGIVTWSPSDFFVIDTAFYVVPKDPSTSTRFLRHLLESLDLARLSADSAVPGVNRNAIYAQNVLQPPRDVLARFHEITESWGVAAAHLDAESATLTHLRDELLPRLLSGFFGLSVAT